MRRSYYMFIFLCCVACINSNKKLEETTTESLFQLQESERVIKFKKLSKLEYDISTLDYEGAIVYKKTWQDINGINVVLFTQKERELFVYHYAIHTNTVELLRKVYDFEEVCEFDLILKFIEESIKVTDLDQNNFGEITFGYKKACISDVSPIGIKLLLLENGEKYIIRGSTTINMGKDTFKGTQNIDSSFQQAPTIFLKHANKVWDVIEEWNL